jgi:type II secretory pathway component PulJ
MNLIEVLISSLLLASSSAAALGVWSQAASEVAASTRLEQQGDQLERLRLASHRWLIAEAGAHTLTKGSCRFAVSSLSAAMDQALPLPEGIRRQWTADPDGLGLWQELEAHPPQGPAGLQRRQLITPAAYGLCQP